MSFSLPAEIVSFPVPPDIMDLIFGPIIVSLPVDPLIVNVSVFVKALAVILERITVSPTVVRFIITTEFPVDVSLIAMVFPPSCALVKVAV